MRIPRKERSPSRGIIKLTSSNVKTLVMNLGYFVGIWGGRCLQ